MPDSMSVMDGREPLQEAGGDDGRGTGWRRREVGGYRCRRLRRGWAEHAGHVREVEHGEEDAHAFDDGGPELGVQLEPVVLVPALDGGDALRVLARRPGVFFDAGRDAERGESVEQFLVVGSAEAAAGGRFPFAVRERVRVRAKAGRRNENAGRWWRPVERAGLFDLLADALGVDGAVVEVAEGHPLVGERPVEFDEPADQVGVRLLPEGFLALAEELVEQGGDGVGERVAVHGGRQRVPLPAPAEGEFDVIVAPSGVFEVGADVVAEVALDFEDESGGPLLRVRGLPREELLGEGAHTGGGLSGPDGAEDGDPGIQAPLGKGEPGGPPDLAWLAGMVAFSDHERGRVVVRRVGPARQGSAAEAAVPAAGAEPEAIGTGDDHDAHEGHDGRHQEMPGADERVEAGVFEPDEVEDGNVAGRGEGARCDGPREREDREQEGGDQPPAEQAVGRFGCAREAVYREVGPRPAARRREAAWRTMTQPRERVTQAGAR